MNTFPKDYWPLVAYALGEKRPLFIDFETDIGQRMTTIFGDLDTIPVEGPADDETTEPEATVDLVDEANRLLQSLGKRATEYAYQTATKKDPLEGLKPLLNDKEFDSARASIVKKNKIAEGMEIHFWGTVPSGTSVVKELGFTSLAMNLLKENDRVLQCGRGRGKAIVVLDITPLPAGTTVPDAIKVATPVNTEKAEDIEVIPANDIPNLLRAARDGYRDLKRAKEEAERNSRSSQNRIEELEAQLAGKDAEIESLKQKLQQQALTTWQ